HTDVNLPEPDIQYSDYSIWQRNWLQGEVLEQQLSYWTEHLAGELPVLELPTDYPRPAHFSFTGKTYLTEIPCSLMNALEAFSHNTDATVFMVALAAYNTLLYRYTGQKDIVTGSIIANRNQSQTEKLLGYFANTLAIRTRFDEVPSFTALLEQVRENCLNAYTHQDLPFERLVEELNPDRELSYTPVFQTLFAYNSFTDLEQSMGDIEFLTKEIESQVARTDLSFSIGEVRKVYGQQSEEKQYQIEIEYCSDLFNEERIACFAEHYINLLQSIVKNPQAKLYDLSILTEKDRQFITESNNTSRSYPDTQCIHHIISQQVKLSPQAIAISYNGEDLSYQQLEDKSDKLAQHLSTAGVGADQLVALCVHRSADMLIAMLAILKSGAAYLPLDPDYPVDRIAFILQDADVSVMITQASIVDMLPQGNIKNVLLDTGWDEQLPPVTTVNRVNVNPDNVAYTIYTSGSTGKPKGVLVPHGAVVNFLSSMSEKPGMKAGDVLLAVTTLSFDIAVLELFLPLFNGAKIELADRDAAADGGVLLEKIDTAGVTVMQATPATWRLMLASGWQKNTGLKVLCGGEAMPGDLAAELLSHAGSVWNMYGPTETTVWSTLYQITDPQQPVLIGRPIANTQVHILDQNMQLLPAGVAGEMYIAGAGVTQGYLKREELNRERFIKLAIAGGEPEIMYRTGDLVRYMPDGNIEYINRLDNQVKVRGFRIELGEIENVLIEHEDVKQVVVIVREDQPGDARLVAYYLSQDGDEIPVTSLRKHLRSLLPDYMIPQHFIELEAFPVTPNGKINQRELPAPFSSSAVDDEFVAPSGANEIMLASIWKEVLNVDRVSIHDNFFEIGGHSLLSVQVITRVKEKTGIKLELRPMVMDTLAQIAAQCPALDAGSEKQSTDKQRNHQKEESFIGRLKAKAKSIVSGHK
ncbi:MAG TPA: amino acid adenylation domain-containing protein, partial [Gammaproteobacteria bacterium]|nr:amino acid adenylation domain-containing protein [Gammaproteobacteria bacterium]